jgi:SAM-dependent methyltransferase
MIAAYRQDLAYIHDTGFSGLASNAAPVLLNELGRRGIKTGLVIDLGCGSGILAHELSASGYEVLGIDISEAMIALARRRVPEGQFRTESLLRAKLPSCVAVAAVGECLNYLFDRGNTRPGLLRLFRRVYNVLSEKGVFIFDVAEPGRVPGPGPRRVFAEGNDWAVLMLAEEDRQRGRLTRRITSFRKAGDLYRRDQEIHHLRLLARSEVTQQLRVVGFRVRTLGGYGQLRFARGHVGFMARKP